jgi:hypothetical protein
LRDGHFAGEQRLQRRDTAGVDDFDIEAMFSKMAGFDGDPGNRLVDRDRAVGQAQRRELGGLGGSG